jgi:hypothetical protein
MILSGPADCTGGCSVWPCLVPCLTGAQPAPFPLTTTRPYATVVADLGEAVRPLSSAEEALDAFDEIWADQRAAGGEQDEAMCTMLARAAAARGDADGALRCAQEAVELERAAALPTRSGAAAGGGGGGVARAVPDTFRRRKRRRCLVRLRTFQPALVAFALAGRAGDALTVAEQLAATGHDYLDLTGGGRREVAWGPGSRGVEPGLPALLVRRPPDSSRRCRRAPAPLCPWVLERRERCPPPHPTRHPLHAPPPQSLSTPCCWRPSPEAAPTPSSPQSWPACRRSSTSCGPQRWPSPRASSRRPLPPPRLRRAAQWRGAAAGGGRRAGSLWTPTGSAQRRVRRRLGVTWG